VNGDSQATRIELTKGEVIEVTICPFRQGSDARGSIVVLSPLNKDAS